MGEYLYLNIEHTLWENAFIDTENTPFRRKYSLKHGTHSMGEYLYLNIGHTLWENAFIDTENTLVG